MNQARREVKSRNRNVFHKLAFFLASMEMRPNHVSILSVVFAAVGAFGFYLIGQGEFWQGFVLSLLGIQLRLLCNLLDGLMAVEGRLSSPQGELYNDVPDRFSDWFLILSCGFVVASMPQGWNLAWIAATLAILTAYVRVLGASQGAGHDFGGPMAKQHRMAVLNLSVIGLSIEHVYFGASTLSLYIGLVVVAFGSAVTIVRRLRNISRKLG